MTTELVVHLVIAVLSVLVIGVAIVFVVLEMLDKAEKVRTALPWIARVIEKRGAVSSLLLACLIMLSFNTYELLLKEVPEIPDPPHVAFSTADPGAKDAEIAKLREQVNAARGSSSHVPAPAPKTENTIKSILVEVRAKCLLRDPNKMPEDVFWGVISQPLASYLEGPSGRAHLQAMSSATYQRSEEEGKVYALERFELPPNSDLLGKPVSSLRSYTTMYLASPTIHGDLFTSCGFAETTLRVNGEDALRVASPVDWGLEKGKALGFLMHLGALRLP
jgi:hypothetical protein